MSGLIGPWATTDGADFAIYDPIKGVRRLGDSVVRPSTLNGAESSSHVRVLDPQLMASDESIASLVSYGLGDLNLSGNTLNVATGGVIVEAHPDKSQLRNGFLTAGGNAGNGELIVHTYGTFGNAEISANIVDSQFGPVAFTKAGSGTLLLAGQNTYTGSTTVNEGQLRILNSDAIPTGGALNADGGELLFEYFGDTPDTVVELSTLRLRQGGLVRYNIDGVQPRIEAQVLELESGDITLPLTGDGQLTKSTRGMVELQQNSPDFSGNVVIDDGVLVAGGTTGFGLANMTRPLGTGLITINCNGILAHGAIAQGATRYEMIAKIDLNGGDVAVVRNTTPTTWALQGEIEVLSDSQLALYDAQVGEVLQEGGTFAVESDVTIRDGVTLNALGPAQFHFDGPVRAGEGSAIHVPEGFARVRDVIVSNAPTASLNLRGGSRVTIESSLHARQEEALAVLVDDEPVVVSVSGNGHFATGGGTIYNSLAIANRGAIQPGDSIGKLTIANNVKFAAQGAFEWEINSALGTAGGPSGWDLLNVDGAVDVSATEEAPFIIRILPRLDDGSLGMPGDFDPFASYAWTVVESQVILGDLWAMSLDDAFIRTARNGLPLGEFELARDGSLLRILYSPPSCLEGEVWPCDQSVDISDLNAVRNNFGAEGALGVPGDVYPFDGKVDIGDLSAVHNHFGESGPQSVPEPNGWLLFSCGGVILLTWRTRRALFPGCIN